MIRNVFTPQTVARLSSRDRLLANVFILIVLVPTIINFVLGGENFPLTSAAMFARDVGHGRPRYTMHWRVDDGQGEKEVFPSALGLSTRHFFLNFYGAYKTGAPYPYTPENSAWEAFENRALIWFDVFVKRCEQRMDREVKLVRFSLRQKHPASGKEYLIAIYDPISQCISRSISQ